MSLRVDPWDPQYGASTELILLEDGQVAIHDLAVETTTWAPIAPSPVGELPCCAFIDGVRRIDLRLIVEEGDLSAPGLAGSWAVGVAWSTRPPAVGQVVTGRELVLGGGLHEADLQANVGEIALPYRCRSVPGRELVDPIQGLQNAMREAEANLARDTFEGGQGDLVVVDGPLTYFSANGPLVGLIKRQARAYLDGEHSRLLGRLAAGERTPIFLIGDQRLERYSWYLRLAPSRAIDASIAGIVRMELAATASLADARATADLASAVLPRFAAVAGRDPRAPQNLYPVGQLEATLRHRLGDTDLVRRAVETAIWRMDVRE